MTRIIDDRGVVRNLAISDHRYKSSAGGYTTLSMIAFRDIVQAGTCCAGISDLELFARETHKFESRYLDRLIGPLPESRKRYRERSPNVHIDGIDCPLLLLHGLEAPRGSVGAS